MCVPAIAGLFAGAAGAGTAAAATGATAAASTLQTIGTIAAVGGSLFQGISGFQAARAQEDAIEETRRVDGILTSVQDQRVREQFRQQISQQSAEIASRGLDLSSPTAVFLGRTAATEMAFASQSVRQDGAARQTELTSSARLARAQGTQSLLRGGFGAAGKFLTAAPQIWPELLS